jgi:hypothetical protein
MTTEPAPPPPDGKDWTWVLERPCPDCDYRSNTPHDEIPTVIRDAVARWQQVLLRPDVRRRPDEQVWSALEYGCHVRDVFGVFGGRLELMLDTDDPHFPNWDQDATAVQSRYWAADPREVSTELAARGEAFARRYATVDGAQWQRSGRRSNGSVFTVETLAWYCLHDVVHHLADVSG